MKKILFIIYLFAGLSAKGQQILIDQSTGVSVSPGSVILSDGLSNQGNCIFRAANSPAGSMWYGPYHTVSAGNYLVSLRMKVSSNVSSANLVYVDVVSSYGAVTHGSILITPSMFRSDNHWELITIPFSIPDGITNLEVRGMGFKPGIADLSLDYITISSGDLNGIYSSEFTIANNGNVGIGTMAPKEKLSVNGKIRAHEVKVEITGWPDYVFLPEYKLQTLSEVEKQIKKNGHLPDIPSAKKIEAVGLELGEINKLLMKKVEELTLHLIEKDKEISYLKTNVIDYKIVFEKNEVANQKRFADLEMQLKELSNKLK